MSRKNRNSKVVEMKETEDQVIDAEIEETSSEEEVPVKEEKKPNKVKAFFKKWGPIFGIGAGVALAAFIGGKASGSNAAYQDMLESEYGDEGEDFDDGDETDTDSEEVTEEE